MALMGAAMLDRHLHRGREPGSSQPARYVCWSPDSIRGRQSRRCLHAQRLAKETLISGLYLVATLSMVIKTEHVAAQSSLSLFQNAAQAQQHCPNDVVVWLDLQRRIYYVQGQRQYGRGRTATFMCREEARRNGNRRSLLGIR